MNMIAPYIVADQQSNHFTKLKQLIAEPRTPREAAYLKACQLLSSATAEACPHDNLWGAKDAFLAHFNLMSHGADIHGSDDPALSDLKDQCRYYLELVEAMTLQQ